MSNPPDVDIDFWEFVGCSICHLHFVSEPGVPPQVPFWLTECGHIICNNHLNADQTCAHCKAQNIQLVPLQRDMDPPMSDWFHSLPHALDGVASAAKFQQETLSREIHFYRAKCHDFVNRLKHNKLENETLKKRIEELTQEIEVLRGRLGFTSASNHGARLQGQDPSNIVNSNGKRQIIDQHQQPTRERTNSSPWSTLSSRGPDRLTLPPGRKLPNFGERQEDEGSNSRPRVPDIVPRTADNRPGSSRFAEQYAYVSPQAPHVYSRQLSHAQTGPLRQFRRQDGAHEQPAQATMAPPPPARFKPAQVRPQSTMNQGHLVSQRQDKVQDQNQPDIRNRGNMGMGPPPPPPMYHAPLNKTSQGNEGAGLSKSANKGNQNNFTILPAAQRFAPSTSRGFPSANGQPSAQPGSGPQRFVSSSATASVSRVPSRAASRPRAPFVPQRHG